MYMKSPHSLIVIFALVAMPHISISQKSVYTVLYGRDLPNLEYPADVKVEEGNLVDERKQGYWTRYYEDGLSIKQKGEYQNNRPDGKFSKYYENGTLKETGTFRGKYLDSLKRYWENGTLAYEAVFNENGNENGTVKYYYKSGKLEYSYTATDGKLSNQSRYSEDGSIIDPKAEHTATLVETDLFLKKIEPSALKPEEKSASFQNSGYNKILRKDAVYQEGEFKNGKLYDGKCHIYNENAVLIQIEIYKQGYLHSYGQI
jgi:antitoxin component YwqK of YwqJK toxin-antitoxin module